MRYCNFIFKSFLNFLKTLVFFFDNNFRGIKFFTKNLTIVDVSSNELIVQKVLELLMCQIVNGR